MEILISTLLHHPFLVKGKTNASSRSSWKNFWRRCRGDLSQVKTYQVPIINSYLLHYIIRHSPLVFLSPTSKMIFENLCLLSLFSYLFSFVYLSLSDLTFASNREGIDTPFIALGVSCLIVCAGIGNLHVLLLLD